MSKNDNSTDEEFEPKFVYSNTPTSATDVINISEAADGTILLQLLSFTPDAVIENHRTVLSHTFISDFLDNLCDAADYYPRKPRKKKPTSKKKIKK